ncbi:MAG TPA: ribonuclease III [Gaiellaceae bacterium]|jgi:ribonuclease-3|nr:ribonuclease III [Gaiellaceae bacterium]
MPSRSRPSDRQSTTSPRTSSDDAGAALLALIEALPRERLSHAFTHASWAPSRADSYERLEFLGDSVLGLAIAEELYERFPAYAEGRLAKIRAHVVSRQSCAVVGRRLGLGELFAGHAGDVDPEELERLAANRNVLAALVEACLGALYLEHGFERIRTPIVAAFRNSIDYAVEGHVDYKTELQEELARRGLAVAYSVVEVEGPPHDRQFTCAANIDGVAVGTGTGASKKAAEQAAAHEALEKLGVEPVSP